MRKNAVSDTQYWKLFRLNVFRNIVIHVRMLFFGVLVFWFFHTIDGL